MRGMGQCVAAFATILLLLSGGAGPGGAQPKSKPEQRAPGAETKQTLTSPYLEQQASEIRGLSSGEIDDLREGRGMGLARAAELNGYPGPRHLLDAVEAGRMHLTHAQLEAVKRLFDSMSSEAKQLGDSILKEEQALEGAFRLGSITEPELQRRVAQIGRLQAELRAVHLRTHFETKKLLTAHQIERYNQLRGYGHDGSGQGHERPAGH